VTPSSARPWLRRLAIAGVLAVALGGAAFGWLKLAPRRVPGGQPALATLDPGSLQEFRDAFNGARGKVRVIALLSPT